MAPDRRLAAVASLLLALSACGGPVVSPAPAEPAGPPASPTAAPPPPDLTSPSAGPVAARLVIAGVARAPFAAARFSDPTTIDNQWLPLAPGTRLVFEGEVNGDGERLPHRVVFTVTDLTKVIDGVEARVAYDLDYTDDQLVEAELAFFAQDDEGNVWHVGQFPQEYEEGEPAATPTWIAGTADAAAGVLMLADPTSTVGSWSEGWAPAAEYDDQARVFETDSATCVPAGCFDHVLVVDEFNPGDPDVHQLKYYAPGVGNVRVGWAGARDDEQEVLELVERVRLGPDELSAVREAALELEQRAYEVSPAVYGRTSPAEPAAAGS